MTAPIGSHYCRHGFSPRACLAPACSHFHAPRLPPSQPPILVPPSVPTDTLSAAERSQVLLLISEHGTARAGVMVGVASAWILRRAAAGELVHASTIETMRRRLAWSR